MAMFCRHNRMTAHCPICRAEHESKLPKAPPRAGRVRPNSPPKKATPTTRSARSPRASSSRLVTRKLARPADDGYRNALVPGMRATADAERLAHALVSATEWLAPPGPYGSIAAEADREQAIWQAFLLAIVGRGDPARQRQLLAGAPSWESGELPEQLTASEAGTARAYRAWAGRAKSQAAAIEGESSWGGDRRFARLMERLAFPGFPRAKRFEFLVALGTAGLFELEPSQLFVAAEDDATTLAAKRLLVSGDRMLLERRARDLARECGVPMAALDRGLADWDDPKADVESGNPLPEQLVRALRLS